MKPSAPLRWLMAAGVIAAAVALLILLLVATDTFLSVYERLAATPLWLRITYFSLLLGVGVLATLLTFKVLGKGRKRSARKPRQVDEASLRQRLAERQQQGLAVEHLQDQLDELDRRRDQQTAYVALFGQVSAGKSALIKALMPEASPVSDVRGGTTRTIEHYRWQNDRGDQVILADMPGFADSGASLDQVARQEAIRSHVVLYLCEGDLTRRQWLELQNLLSLEKPLIVVFNKADRFEVEERNSILRRLRERLANNAPDAPTDVVAISAGGSETVRVESADGQLQDQVRQRPPDVDSLRASINRALRTDPSKLDARRDQAVFVTVDESLQRSEAGWRADKAQALVRTYSRRAMVGAMAAITPGSDIVIQGALATKFIHDLCRLYDVPVREVDIDEFLKLAGSKVRNITSIALAVAGNALKAFPGAGTVAGGLLHAVAYGMIFESLGTAASATLSQRGSLQPEDAARTFEEQLEEAMQGRARHFARLAWKELAKRDQAGNSANRGSAPESPS